MVLIVTIVTMMMSKYLQNIEGPLSENIALLKYVIKYFVTCIIIIQVKTFYENKIISN